MLCSSSYRLRVQRRERWRAHKTSLGISGYDVGPRGLSPGHDDVGMVVALPIGAGRGHLPLSSLVKPPRGEHRRSRDD
jgi:hypothetical protein